MNQKDKINNRIEDIIQDDTKIDNSESKDTGDIFEQLFNRCKKASNIIRNKSSDNEESDKSDLEAEFTQTDSSQENNSREMELEILKQDKIIENHIPGLYIYRNLISSEEQEEIIKDILQQNIFPGLKEDLFNFDITKPDGLDTAELKSNQNMQFGKLNKKLMTIIQSKLVQKEFSKSIKERQPMFNQAIYNLYLPGQGIKPHFDLLNFEDGILGLSLISSVLFSFFKADKRQIETGTSYAKEWKEGFNLCLNKGDVYFLTKEARYNWCHGIKECLVDHLNDSISLQRQLRISITLRKVKEQAKLVEFNKNS